MAYAQDQSVTYQFDSNNKTIDITVPAGFTYIYLEAQGADGGKLGDWRSHGGVDAGQGARVSGYARIGNGYHEIPAGSTLRFIPGQVGSNGSLLGGGGGGTAVATKGANLADAWRVLMVAGGGGGAGDTQAGLPGSTSPNGSDGSNVGGSKMGNAGTGGDGAKTVKSTYGQDGGYPGGGANSDGQGGGCAGKAGLQHSVPTGGTASCGTAGAGGGFGFGSGGGGYQNGDKGNYCGGGGGGYSGGGGGAAGGGGGGGGSYANEDWLPVKWKESFATTGNPRSGYIRYRFSNIAPNRFIHLAKDQTKCITNYTGKPGNGNNIALQTCSGPLAVAQQWVFEGSSVRLIEDLNTCLDLDHSNTANGTNIQLWGCDYTNAQQWFYDGIGQNIRSSIDQNKCLDLVNGKTTDGNNIQLWDCNNIGAQKWIIDSATTVTVSSTKNRIHYRKDTGICVNVESGSTANGANVQIYRCQDNDSQYWYFDGNAIRFNKDRNKCMDLNQSKTDHGTNIQLYDCNGTNAQKWTYDGVTQSFRSWVSPDKCLDVDHSGTADHTNVQLYDCNGTDAQQFVIGQ